MKRILTGLAVAALAVAIWWWWPKAPAPAPLAVPTPAPVTLAEPTPPPAPPSHYAPLDQLNQPGASVTNDLRILRDLFFHYQIVVKDPSGNPAGTHEEIVRALQGRNRARLAFLPAQHPALNEKGQLVDRWGTPYFFHALGSTRMEIRSAGPDGKLFTADDALLSPTDPNRRPEKFQPL